MLFRITDLIPAYQMKLIAQKIRSSALLLFPHLSLYLVDYKLAKSILFIR